MGVKITTGATYSSTTAQAVFLEGAQRCIVNSVVADSENIDIVNLMSRAVYATSFTVNAVLRNSTDNHIGPIIVANIDKPVVEADANQDRNIYEIANRVSMGGGSTLLGPASYVRDAFKLIKRSSY